MRFLFLSLVLFCSLAVAHKKVEVVSTGTVDDTHLTHVLQARGFDGKVISTSCTQLGKGMMKDRSLWGKILKKVALDFPKMIKLDPETAKVVFMNIPNHFSRDYNVAKLPKEKMVLFMWEPYIRFRKMYSPKLHSRFSRIYTWNDDLVDNKHYFKFYYPVMRPMIDGVPSFEEKKLCVLISACASDKYPKKYPNELYSERRKAAKFFESMGESGFELYGRDWNVKENSSYRGAPEDKIDIIKQFRFSICYENCKDVRGYVTEKIFDCFHAGNVPIYWGASNITDYIPKGCFIDRRDFATLDELYAFIKNMTKQEYNGYLERIREYLKSDQAKLFSQENFEKTFFEAACAT